MVIFALTVFNFVGYHRETLFKIRLSFVLVGAFILITRALSLVTKVGERPELSVELYFLLFFLFILVVYQIRLFFSMASSFCVDRHTDSKHPKRTLFNRLVSS